MFNKLLQGMLSIAFLCSHVQQLSRVQRSNCFISELTLTNKWGSTVQKCFLLLALKALWVQFESCGGTESSKEQRTAQLSLSCWCGIKDGKYKILEMILENQQPPTPLLSVFLAVLQSESCAVPTKTRTCCRGSYGPCGHHRRLIRRSIGCCDARNSAAILECGWGAGEQLNWQLTGRVYIWKQGCRAGVQRIPAQMSGPSKIGIGGLLFTSNC